MLDNLSVIKLLTQYIERNNKENPLLVVAGFRLIYCLIF